MDIVNIIKNQSKKSLFINPRLIIIGCLRPSVQFSLLKRARRFPKISFYLVQNIVLGFLVEPIYWIQKCSYKRPKNMPEPIFIIGSWRSGTTYLHSELVKATNAATIKNTFSCCPQAALILKEFIRKLIPSFNNRFFDWVPLPSEGPQELDIALLRFSCQHPPSSIGIGESLSKDLERWYKWKASTNFKKKLQLILEWAWIHDGSPGKIFINKAPAFTTRVDILLEIWPKAKFIYIERKYGLKKSIAKSIKSFNKEFGFIPYIGDSEKDSQLTKSFIFEKWKSTKKLIKKENLVEIQYEDLINMPKETIQNLKKFTGVSNI